MAEDHEGQAQPWRLYDVGANDPEALLLDLSSTSEQDLAEINDVMASLGRLRDAERELSDASQRYMKLGKTDMRALHYLIVAQHADALATPSAIAAHLGISTASTTKLLDRLETAGHIVRTPHPTDRRALVIRVTEETRAAATETVGRLQAKRFHAAARLTSQERAVVVRFLDDMSEQIALRSAAWAHSGNDPNVQSIDNDSQ